MMQRFIQPGGAFEPWWWIPTVSGEFVWRMEDLLDLYAQPMMHAIRSSILTRVPIS